jgi:Arc/MetJ family transcription regulator
MCMRTNIVIDDELMAAAMRAAATRTKRETVDLALRELLARRKRLGMLEVAGTVNWTGDLDASRRGRDDRG